MKFYDLFYELQKQLTANILSYLPNKNTNKLTIIFTLQLPSTCGVNLH